MYDKIVIENKKKTENTEKMESINLIF